MSATARASGRPPLRTERPGGASAGDQPHAVRRARSATSGIRRILYRRDPAPQVGDRRIPIAALGSVLHRVLDHDRTDAYPKG